MDEMYVDTDHGVYDVLAVRESDEAPDGATHAVFHESGSLAGFAAANGWAWNASGALLPSSHTLAGAVTAVAESDA